MALCTFSPLHGKELFELAEKHGKLAEKHLKVGQGGFHDDRLMEEFDVDINIRNEYIQNIKENGNLIRQILATSYYLVDTDDFDLFQRFLLDYRRLDIEFEGSGKLKIPLRIYKEIEPPHFLDLKLAEQVESKFQFKQRRLNQLSEDNNRLTMNVRILWNASRSAFSEWATKLLRLPR